MKTNLYYAPSLEHITFAADNGFTKVVLDSRGHTAKYEQGKRNDDIMCLMREVPQIYNLRKKFADEISAAKQEVRRRVDFAKSLGLQVYFHSYELSMPPEIMEVFPELAVGHVSEIIAEDILAKTDKYLCLSNPEVRRLVSLKITEWLEDFSDIDGLIYSFHESSTSTYSHVCDQCKQYPDRFPFIEWLNKAIAAGVCKVSSNIEIIPRLWGINHVAGLGSERIEIIADFHENDPSLWYCRRPTSRAKYIYNPEVVNRKIKDYAEANNLSLMYKATWGDYTLNQPLNRWANQYGNAHQIIELSLEHCVGGKYIPLIMSHQHQDFIKKTQGENISYAIVPVNWGRVCKSNTKELAVSPLCWGLNKLNLTIATKLLEDPDLDINKVMRKEIETQYGIDCGDEFVELLLQTAEVMDMAININGISTVMNLDYLLMPTNYTLKHFVRMLLWYAIMRKDWENLISVNDDNTAIIMASLDNAVKETDNLYTSALETIANINAEDNIKAEFKQFFENFKDLTTMLAVSRQRLWLQFKIQQTHQINIEVSMKLDDLLAKERQLISGSQYLSDIFNDKFEPKLGWGNKSYS